MLEELLKGLGQGLPTLALQVPGNLGVVPKDDKGM